MEELVLYISDCIIPRNEIIFENLPAAYQIHILFTFILELKDLLSRSKRPAIAPYPKTYKFSLWTQILNI
jgi:hypothetical protein